MSNICLSGLSSSRVSRLTLTGAYNPNLEVSHEYLYDSQV
jgi:hypothetical protein